MRAYSDLLAGLEADLGVETEVHVPCFPLVVSDNEEAARRRSAGNGVRRICAAGKKHAVYENVAEAVVQVVYACEDRLLVVAHEPRVCIDFGGEDQAASERLENKIVLEVIDAGGYAHAVILREAEKLRYVAAACKECAVMRRGDEVAHVYVDICFGTLPEEGGRIGHSDSEPEAVVEQYEIGRILAAFLHHLDEQGLMLLGELSAYTVDLELSKVEIAAERYHLLGARLCAFLGVAESVGTAPYSEAGSDLCSGLCDRTVAVRILLLELFGFSEKLICACASVEVSGIPCVDLETHSVCIVEITEIVEIYEGLSLGGAFVRAVYP